MDKALLKKLRQEKQELLDLVTRKEMSHLEHKKIMIIDDSEETRFMMTTFLKKTGEYELVTFSNEFEALEEITVHAPDLIILDIMLQKTDGIHFAKAIRSLEVFQGPIVFISSNPSYKKELIKTFGEKVEFFSKPIDKTKFADSIIRLLESYQSARK